MQTWPTPPAAFTCFNCNMHPEEWRVFEAYARTGKFREKMYDVPEEFEDR